MSWVIDRQTLIMTFGPPCSWWSLKLTDKLCLGVAVCSAPKSGRTAASVAFTNLNAITLTGGSTACQVVIIIDIWTVRPSEWIARYRAESAQPKVRIHIRYRNVLHWKHHYRVIIFSVLLGCCISNVVFLNIGKNLLYKNRFWYGL